MINSYRRPQNLHRLIFILLNVSFAAITAHAEGTQCPLSEENLANHGLEKFVEGMKGDQEGVAAAICCLPEEYRENYSIVFNSHSAQPSEPGFPRVLLFDPEARGSNSVSRVISFSGGPHIEQVSFNYSTTSAYAEANHTVAPVNGNVQGHVDYETHSCDVCHVNGRPISDSGSLHPNAFGGANLTSDLNLVQRELRNLQRFNLTLKDPQKGKSYRCLKDIDKSVKCRMAVLKNMEHTLEQTQGKTCNEQTREVDRALQTDVEGCTPAEREKFTRGNSDLSDAMAKLGADKMVLCVSTKANPDFQPALLGLTACPGSDISNFMPDCVKIPDPLKRRDCEALSRITTTVPPVDPSSSTANALAANVGSACSYQKDLAAPKRQAAAVYNSYRSVLRMSGADSCGKDLMVNSDRVTTDPFTSVRWGQFLRAQVGVLGASEKIDDSLKKFVTEIKLDAVRGKVSPESIGTDQCQTLAKVSRHALAKFFGMASDGNDLAKDAALARQLDVARKSVEEARHRVTPQISQPQTPEKMEAEAGK